MRNVWEVEKVGLGVGDGIGVLVEREGGGGDVVKEGGIGLRVRWN